MFRIGEHRTLGLRHVRAEEQMGASWVFVFPKFSEFGEGSEEYSVCGSSDVVVHRFIQ